MVVHYKYCPLCGDKLTLRSAGDDGMIPYCSRCGEMWFDNFSSCVIVMTYNEYNEILLTRQPHLTTKHWVYTSGFIVPGETAEHAAAREVKEELGIELERVEGAGTCWFAPGGMLMHAFLGFAHKTGFTFSDEVIEAGWFDLKTASQMVGPVRQGCADYAMMEKFAMEHCGYKQGELWPGQKLG